MATHNPFELLYQEHEVIKRAIYASTKLEKLWERDTTLFIEAIQSFVRFFRDYADGYHHGKEEQILFPVVDNHPDFMLQELTRELGNHHEDFRSYTSDILEALDEADYARSYKILTHYGSELLDHIAAEDDEYFVVASNLLDANQSETLYFRFHDVDRDQGETRKHQYEQMVERWEAM